ncbi:MAG: sigma-70 family RNA polymerase sigma factor [Oscillospiraceae bacterium]|jgi:RNA polymerase sigma factor (sigma-70 family)|nr:sigma-70 family RNA polymerase sigma factor [Oscillospiraceae bacterium]
MDKAKLTEIIKSAQAGDDSSLETLYREYSKSVYYLSLKLLKNKEDAEDITQEVFIYVYQKIGELQTSEAFTVWLNRITTNKATDFLRKKRILVDIDEEGLSESEFFEESDPLLIPEKYVDNAETAQMIVEIIDTLPLPQRLCIYYYYYEQLTVAQIAENLATNENTVKTRLSVARAKIRKELERLNNEDGLKLYGIPLLLTPILKMPLQKFEMPHGLTDGMLGRITAEAAVNTAALSAGTAATVKGAIIMGAKAKIAMALGGLILVGGITTVVLLSTSGEDDSPALVDSHPSREASAPTNNINDITINPADNIENSITAPESAVPVEIVLWDQGITNEILAAMVVSGEIPANVTHLNLSSNLITDISPLSELTNLKHLDLARNENIADLTPLNGLVNLVNLNLYGVNSGNWTLDDGILVVNELDLTPLSGLVNLESLNLHMTSTRDITPLSGMTKMQYLDLSFSTLTDISALSGMTEMRDLLLSRGSFDVTPLFGMTKMTRVGLILAELSDEQIDELQTALPD